MNAAPQMPGAVAAVFAAWPHEARAALSRLRALIFETAEETGTAPLDEALRWGQPACRPAAPRTGTTIRLWHVAGPSPCQMLVPCSTDLLDRWRDRFGGELDLMGDRCVRLPAGALPDGPLHSCIAMALTYHRDQGARRG